MATGELNRQTDADAVMRNVAHHPGVEHPIALVSVDAQEAVILVESLFTRMSVLSIKAQEYSAGLIRTEVEAEYRQVKNYREQLLNNPDFSLLVAIGRSIGAR